MLELEDSLQAIIDEDQRVANSQDRSAYAPFPEETRYKFQEGMIMEMSERLDLVVSSSLVKLALFLENPNRRRKFIPEDIRAVDTTQIDGRIITSMDRFGRQPVKRRGLTWVSLRAGKTLQGQKVLVPFDNKFDITLLPSGELCIKGRDLDGMSYQAGDLAVVKAIHYAFLHPHTALSFKQPPKQD